MPSHPIITPRCLVVNSEVVLQTQFTTDTQIVGIVCSQEGEFTIDSDGIGNRNTNTCLTREFSLGVNTINSNDCWTRLDVVRSSTDFSLVTYVDVCRCSGVIISRPTSIGFHVDVGTCKGSACGH